MTLSIICILLRILPCYCYDVALYVFYYIYLELASQNNNKLIPLSLSPSVLISLSLSLIIFIAFLVTLHAFFIAATQSRNMRQMNIHNGSKGKYEIYD